MDFNSFIYFVFYSLQMKALLIILFLPFLSFTQVTPKKDQLKAKRICANAVTLLNEGQSSNAYMLLKQAVALDPNNANAFYWLAASEYDLRSYNYAKEHSDQALKLLSSAATLDELYLASQIEMALSQASTAMTHLAKAKTLVKKEKDFELLGFAALEKQCAFYLAQKAKATDFQGQVLAPELNTKYDEYGPILSADGQTLYFTTRNPDSRGANLNPDDQRFFEDIYLASTALDDNGKWTRFFSYNDLLNTEGFDALSYVSKDGLLALGTLNTTASKEASTQGSDIFELTAEANGVWDDKRIINEIPGLNTSYFEGSPSKTDTIWIDENTYVEELYFVSDREAEKFATDIYVAQKINGIWQAEVKALGRSINTEGRETTPYVTPDGQFLFFASDGHEGMGGYDIFVCKREGKEWSAPVNLGAAINTTLDDTHFQIAADQLRVIWASVSEIDGLFSYNLFEAPIGVIQSSEK
jgi:tetratricopeptide (TPR) repeat protein